METDNKRLYDGTGEEQTSKKYCNGMNTGGGYPSSHGATFSYVSVTPPPVDPLTFLYNQIQALEKVVQELSRKVHSLEARLPQQPVITGPSNYVINPHMDPCANRCIGSSSLSRNNFEIVTGPCGPMGVIGPTGPCGPTGLRY